jgi:hypothetical protein
VLLQQATRMKNERRKMISSLSTITITVEDTTVEDTKKKKNDWMRFNRESRVVHLQ